MFWYNSRPFNYIPIKKILFKFSECVFQNWIVQKLKILISKNSGLGLFDFFRVHFSFPGKVDLESRNNDQNDIHWVHNFWRNPKVCPGSKKFISHQEGHATRDFTSPSKAVLVKDERNREDGPNDKSSNSNNRISTHFNVEFSKAIHSQKGKKEV